MKVRHYFSTESLKAHGLRIAKPQNGYGVYNKDHDMIAEAWLDGAYFYTTTTGQELQHTDLLASVSYMTHLTFEDHILTSGHYRGQGWEADLCNLNNGKTQIDICVTCNDVSKLKDVYQKLVTGQLLPAFVVKDKQLTSKQVADVVFGNGDREHWLHVVQSAQDTILKSAETVRNLQNEVAELNRQLAILKPA